MYYQHNLRVKLQEWMNRIYQTPEHFNSNSKFFYENVKNNLLLNSIIENEKIKHPDVIDEVKNFMSDIERTGHRRDITFHNEAHKGLFFYLIITEIEESGKDYNFHSLALGRTQDELVNYYVDYYIKPVVHFLEDSLDDGSFILHILEKYKFRTENFTKKELLLKYNTATSNYEQILEDDLRLYLFDQGVENPFSTPKSATGRSDIIGQLDTSDPLVLEVKIIDSNKKYNKNRVLSGFKQVVQYTNDYNKPVGYLVTFVLDDMQVEVENTMIDKTWPSKIEFAGNQYNLIFIYLNSTSASKGKINKVLISRNELTKAIEKN